LTILENSFSYKEVQLKNVQATLRKPVALQPENVNKTLASAGKYCNTSTGQMPA